ncbi:MAG TPA: hypothetical protein GX693_07690 [Firmicutes bacterium]|nr:hypothetical protein [Bacillota bacterium]
MSGRKNYVDLVNQWEYCYCPSCKRIRSIAELVVSDTGISCAVCGSNNLDSPGWVICPHRKVSAVKCPRSGKGIIRDKHGARCQDRCSFRI